MVPYVQYIVSMAIVQAVKMQTQQQVCPARTTVHAASQVQHDHAGS